MFRAPLGAQIGLGGKPYASSSPWATARSTFDGQPEAILAELSVLAGVRIAAVATNIIVPKAAVQPTIQR